jgi:ribosomal protein L24E
MAIRVKLGDTEGVAGRRAFFYPACDHCGDEISADDPGNCEFVEEDGAEVYLLHKRCTSAFRAGRPKMLWSDLVELQLKAR